MMKWNVVWPWMQDVRMMMGMMGIAKKLMKNN